MSAVCKCITECTCSVINLTIFTFLLGFAEFINEVEHWCYVKPWFMIYLALQIILLLIGNLRDTLPFDLYFVTALSIYRLAKAEIEGIFLLKAVQFCGLSCNHPQKAWIRIPTL